MEKLISSKILGEKEVNLFVCEELGKTSYRVVTFEKGKDSKESIVEVPTLDTAQMIIDGLEQFYLNKKEKNK